MAGAQYKDSIRMLVALWGRELNGGLAVSS